MDATSRPTTSRSGLTSPPNEGQNAGFLGYDLKSLYLMRLFAITLICFASLPVMAQAQCRIAIAGTACVAVPNSSAVAPDPVEIGEVLERGQYQMIMNARYYGLPAVSDGWVYMRIEDEIYRVDWRTHTVLEKVTDQASRNW